MAPTRPQPSAKVSMSFMPKMPASTSFTPPSAASRLVCIQTAEMPARTSWNGTSCGPSLLSGSKMTGWWDTIISHCFAAASSTTSGVMSSAISTRCTAPPQSTSRPGLSQLSASSSGAMACIASYTCRTVIIALSPLLKLHRSRRPVRCHPVRQGASGAALPSANRRSLFPRARRLCRRTGTRQM